MGGGHGLARLAPGRDLVEQILPLPSRLARRNGADRAHASMAWRDILAVPCPGGRTAVKLSDSAGSASWHARRSPIVGLSTRRLPN